MRLMHRPDPRLSAARSRCPAPISFGCRCPRHHPRSAAWFSSSPIPDGKAHPKRGALTLLAFHLDTAAVRLDDHLGLKHADAEPFLLGALKRVEQGVLQESHAHSAAVVPDSENDAVAEMLRADADTASRPNRVPRVEHQIGHNALNLFAVSPDIGERL